MQIGNSLNGIGEGLLVDFGVLGAGAIADRAIADGSVCKLIYRFTPFTTHY